MVNYATVLPVLVHNFHYKYTNYNNKYLKTGIQYIT
jgi:hypothetical protein